MTKLDGYNIIGGNENQLFGVDVDTLFMDASTVSYTINDFSAAIRIAEMSTFSRLDVGQNELGGMPVAGKIIGVIWMVDENTANPQTHTVDILKNGIVQEAGVLVVAALQKGWLKSETLNIPFVAGDRLAWSRKKSGATNGGIKGVLTVCVSFA